MCGCMKEACRAGASGWLVARSFGSTKLGLESVENERAGASPFRVAGVRTLRTSRWSYINATQMHPEMGSGKLKVIESVACEEEEGVRGYRQQAGTTAGQDRT